MQKILITGVAGFIGSHLASRFVSEGYAVVGVDDLSNGHRENVPNDIEFIEGDLSLSSTISRLPRDCKKILHLAGQSSGEISFDSPIADLNKNTITTLNLIEFAIKNNLERFLYASSMSVYGDGYKDPVKESSFCKPLSCYGTSKYASESYLRVYGDKLPTVTLRMFNVYGPGQDLSNLRQGMVSIYLAQALQNGKIEVKGGTERFRDFIFIDDVVETWFRAANSDLVIGKTLNVGTGVKTLIGELLELICKHVPNSKYFSKGSTPGDQNGIYADTSNLSLYLGMDSFTPLHYGLQKFVEWAKSQK